MFCKIMPSRDSMEGTMRKLIGLLIVLVAIASWQAPAPVEGQILQWACR